MYSVGTYPREALFLHLKEATRSCKDYTIRGFNNYDDLLASLESHYGGEQKIIRAKNNNELEVLHKMKMVKRQLVKLGYEQKLDKFSISGMAKSCFSIATRNHFATKLAERSFELAGEDEITEGAYSMDFWNFVELRIKSLQNFETMLEKEHKQRDFTPSTNSYKRERYRDSRSGERYRDSRSGREYGSRADREAGKTLLNYSKPSIQACQYQDCLSSEHRTYQCPKLVGANVNDAIRSAAKSKLCLSCLRTADPYPKRPVFKYKTPQGDTIVDVHCDSCMFQKMKLNRGICKHAVEEIEENEDDNLIFDGGKSEDEQTSSGDDQPSEGEAYFYKLTDCEPHHRISTLQLGLASGADSTKLKVLPQFLRSTLHNHQKT